jgi:molybdate transport system substrate-binding protein
MVSVLAAACGAGGGANQPARAADPSAAVANQPEPAARSRANGYITVVAADSITPVMEQEARAFQTAHRLSTVSVESGPSSTLAAQLERGRTADLYVAAGSADMDGVVDAGLIYESPLPFARSPRSAAPALTYSIALMNTTGDQATSRAFMRFLTTRTGRSILSGAGFPPIP